MNKYIIKGQSKGEYIQEQFQGRKVLIVISESRKEILDSPCWDRFYTMICSNKNFRSHVNKLISHTKVTDIILFGWEYESEIKRLMNMVDHTERLQRIYGCVDFDGGVKIVKIV